MNEEEVCEFLALQRLVVWLAAREIGKDERTETAMSVFSDELHIPVDQNPPPPGHPFHQHLGRVAASIDSLVQQVAKEVHRIRQ